MASPALPEAPSIKTDRAEYRVLADGRLRRVVIALRYTNRTADTTYLAACRGPVPPLLEKWAGTGWVRAYEAVHLMCLEPPVVIAPGRSLAYTFDIAAGVPASGVVPEFLVPTIPGRYRLQWGLATARIPGEPYRLADLIPLAHRVSNEFRLIE